jgi:DNA-directed RNA polymerase subunit RPC12/RpoP
MVDKRHKIDVLVIWRCPSCDQYVSEAVATGAAVVCPECGSESC